jgi:hypothetical protein
MAGPEDIEKLAEDWIALWQSEVAGLAADAELIEKWAAFASLGAAWFKAAAQFSKPFTPGATQHDSTVSPSRPAPAAAPSGAGRDTGHGGSGGAAQDAMAERIATLERRLADLESGAGGGSAHQRRPRQRRPRA